MRCRAGTTAWVTLLLLLPMLVVIDGTPADPFPAVEAATDCTIDGGASPPNWGENTEKMILTGGGEWGHDWEEQQRWDEQSMWGYRGRLSALDRGFHTAFNLENDSAVGIRMNLTTGWKYTFCVSFTPEVNSSNTVTPLADVYLLQEMDYDRYVQDFDTRYNDWGGFREDIESSPPWVQNAMFWHPFRDVHAYENLDEVEFAVALDHEERSMNFWDERPEPRTMYIMVETWDNIRNYDAKPQNRNVTVDLTVMVEVRFALPNWTVAIVCCGGLIGILAAPFLVHHRYMKAGLVGLETADLMPHLEVEAEIPAAVIAPTDPGTAPPP